jgi:hypothetical protein
MQPSTNPGEGWRILGKGELIESGDECTEEDFGVWYPTAHAAGDTQAPSYIYRRKVEPKTIEAGEGWRILDNSEKVLEGDEYFDNGEWEEALNWLCSTAQQATNRTYRRRIDPKPNLVEALEVFFEKIDYKKWCSDVEAVMYTNSSGTRDHLGTKNFERLYEALLKHRPQKEKIIPTQASLSDGPIVAEFRDSEKHDWQTGKLIAIAVSGDCRFFDDSTDEWYALCRIEKQ